MTYVRNTHLARRSRARGAALGGILDTLLGKSPAQQCIDKANASAQVKMIDDEIARLAKTWHPSGYYTVAELQSVMNVLATEAAAAGAALAAAPRSTSDATDQINQAFADLKRKYQSRAYLYEDAIATARAGGGVIDAPGMKDWVIASMRAISDAYVVAYVMDCMQGRLGRWLERGYSAMATVGGVAHRIIGVAVTGAQTIIKVADRGLDLALAVAKYGPYAALGVGGYVLYQMAKKRR